MKTLESLVAEKLLKIKAVKLQPANPFTWASGWKSPIYNDNRKTLSYPVVRSFIKLELARVISEKFENVDAIAGVETDANDMPVDDVIIENIEFKTFGELYNG